MRFITYTAVLFAVATSASGDSLDDFLSLRKESPIRVEVIDNTVTDKVRSGWDAMSTQYQPIPIMEEISNNPQLTSGTEVYECKLVCRTSGILHDVRDLGAVTFKARRHEIFDKLNSICNKLSGKHYWYHSSDTCPR